MEEKYHTVLKRKRERGGLDDLVKMLHETSGRIGDSVPGKKSKDRYVWECKNCEPIQKASNSYPYEAGGTGEKFEKIKENPYR